MNVVEEVFEVIKDRKKNPKPGSYVSSMFEKGEDKIIEKIGEEAAELIVASKNNKKAEIIHEATDLIFHVMVLLGYKGIELKEIYGEFKRRKK